MAVEVQLDPEMSRRERTRLLQKVGEKIRHWQERNAEPPTTTTNADAANSALEESICEGFYAVHSGSSAVVLTERHRPGR